MALSYRNALQGCRSPPLHAPNGIDHTPEDHTGDMHCLSLLNMNQPLLFRSVCTVKHGLITSMHTVIQMFCPLHSDDTKPLTSPQWTPHTSSGRFPPAPSLWPTTPHPPPSLLPSPHFFFLWNRPIKALKQLELLPYSTCFLSHFPRPPLTYAQTHIQTFPHMHKHTASYVHSISLAEPLPPHPPNLCPADRPESQSAWRAVSRVRQNRQRVRRRGGNVGKIGPRRAS